MPSKPAAPADRRPLAERLRPLNVDDVLGDPRVLRRFLEWARTWAASTRPPRWRAVILSGPPGVGKTTLATALARTMGWSLVEMNASDARNESAIEETAGRASLSHTLGSSGTYRGPTDGGRALILLDEADCLSGRASDAGAARSKGPTLREFLNGRYGSVRALAEAWGLGAPGRPAPFESWADVPTTGGRGAWTRLAEAQRDLADWKGASVRRDSSDRGGYAAIVRLVRDTRQPIVLTVNDEWELLRHAAPLRGLALRLALPPIAGADMRAFLLKAARRERLPIAASAIDAIVRRSRGDLRAAVNDLEAIAPLPPGPLQESVLSVRDLTTDLADLTGTVLSEPRVYRAAEIRDRVDASPEDLWPWIAENVPHFARDRDTLERGLERVATAELLVARARRQRVYALWSFASEVMTGGAGLALVRDGMPAGGTVSFPAFLGRMGQSRAARATRDTILRKVGAHLHHSRRKGTEESLPFLEGLFSVGPAHGAAARRRFQDRLAESLELSEDEVTFLGGRPARPARSPAEERPVPDLPGDSPEPPGPASEPQTDPTVGGSERRRVQKRLPDA